MKVASPVSVTNVLFTGLVVKTDIVLTGSGSDFRSPPQEQGFGDPRDRRMFDPRDPRAREPLRGMQACWSYIFWSQRYVRSFKNNGLLCWLVNPFPAKSDQLQFSLSVFHQRYIMYSMESLAIDSLLR